MFGLPSTTNPNSAPTWMTAAMGVPGLAPLVAEVSYHRYAAPSAGTLAAIASAAATLHAQTAQLEHIDADHNELYDDLTLANVSSWSRFVLGGPLSWGGGGGLYSVDDTTGAITLQPGAQYLRQYFRTIRPGMQRVGASSTSGAIRPVAFRAADGRTVVVANTTGATMVAVAGLPAGTYQVTFATAATPMGTAPAVTIRAGEVLRVTMPGAGVIAIAP